MKFLKLTLIALTLSAGLMAEKLRQIGLGAPVAFVDDSSLIYDYPATIGNFANELNYLAMDSFTGGEFNLFTLYHLSDTLSFAIDYYETTDTTTSFDDTGTFMGVNMSALAFGNTNDLDADWDYKSHTAFTALSMEVGSIAAGLAIQNTFPENISQDQTILSNGDLVEDVSLSGFKTSLAPSAVLQVGDFQLLTTAYANMAIGWTYLNQIDPTNTITIESPFLEEAGAMAMTRMPFGDKTFLAAEGSFSVDNTGFSLNTVTNDSEEYNTNFEAGSFSYNVSVGAEINASEKVNLYFTVPYGQELSTEIHGEGTEEHDQTQIIFTTLPTLQFAGDITFGKSDQFVLSGFANPNWERETEEPKKEDGRDGGSADVEREVRYDFYTVMGLGFRYVRGPFAFQANVSTATMNDLGQNPLEVTDGIFNGAFNDFFTDFELIYYYD